MKFFILLVALVALLSSTPMIMALPINKLQVQQENHGNPIIELETLPTYTLLKVRVGLATDSIGSWTVVAQQLQGSLANCFDAASTMLSNYENTQFTLFGAQTEDQKNLDQCQENVIIPIVNEIKGTTGLIEFKNDIYMPNSLRCVTSTSETAPNRLVCGTGCSPCAVGALCDASSECVYGDCALEDPTDQFKVCLGNDGMMTGLQSLLGLALLVVVGMSF